MVINKTQEQEVAYLKKVISKLQAVYKIGENALQDKAREIQDFKNYLWDNLSELDNAEKNAVRQSVTQGVMTGENLKDKQKRLAKLILSPYFGRIDFHSQADGDELPAPIYIGIHSFYDVENRVNLIHDWRAPISGMFYDFELGEAHFESPAGEVKGNIQLKRQYRIRRSILEFMLESSLNIHDDILQKELSGKSDERMKNIVATIQREQNRIIRNESAPVLIIQGVAGSGKTSIALHRVAYLLYRNKKTIKSADMLIISPNKVFSDYISNVLPELGEDTIPELGFEELIDKQLNGKYKFQTFLQQVAELTETHEEAFVSRIRYKAGYEFVRKLQQYATYADANYFDAQDMKIGRHYIAAQMIKKFYDNWHRVPVRQRFALIAKDVRDELYRSKRIELTIGELSKMRSEITKMFRYGSDLELYQNFFVWAQAPEMFVMRKGRRLENNDISGLLYLKILMEGVQSISSVKHLLVDEMQDYTAVQYALLARLFTCRKTILGDISQSVNPYSASSADDISRIFPQGECMRMFKSYRSTFEITKFAQNISANINIEAIERHGDKPALIQVENGKKHIEALEALVRNFDESTNKTCGIICKTDDQVKQLFHSLTKCGLDIHLLNEESIAFINGVVMTTAYMAKGLEFDEIIVPDVSEKNYSNEVDKSLLYVACTRAMHKLSLTSVGEFSHFIASVE